MSSDSSEEENLELLREAQDVQFINDSMFSDSFGKSSDKSSEKRNKRVLPSLRKSQDEDEQFNILKVTPQFRSYVAKQLSSILDRKLSEKFTDLEAPEVPRKKRRKSRVKLLSESKHFIDLTQEELAESSANVAHNTKAKLSKNKKNIRNEVPEELLREVVVTPDDVLSKKEVKHWSARTKAPVFHYKKKKNGELEQVEPEFK